MADGKQDKQVSYWRFKLAEDGPEYELKRSELTMGVLRQFKAWYGPPYGKFLTFTQLLLEGDAEAWGCAIWLCQRNAGEKPRNPQNMDYAIGDLMFSVAEEEAEAEGEDTATTAGEREEDEADPLPPPVPRETIPD